MQQRRIPGKSLQAKGEFWKFAAPAVVLTAIFMLYPIIYSIYISLHKLQGLNREFVGFSNYRRMFSDAVFWKSLGNTFLYLMIQVPLILVMGLVFAVLVNAPKLRFRTFFRTALFLPCVTSQVAYSVLFKMIFQTGGLVNKALMQVGLLSAPINWLNDPFWAKATIILALCWRWTGYNMMFFWQGYKMFRKKRLKRRKWTGREVQGHSLRLLYPS